MAVPLGDHGTLRRMRPGKADFGSRRPRRIVRILGRVRQGSGGRRRPTRQRARCRCRAGLVKRCRKADVRRRLQIRGGRRLSEAFLSVRSLFRLLSLAGWVFRSRQEAMYIAVHSWARNYLVSVVHFLWLLDYAGHLHRKSAGWSMFFLCCAVLQAERAK